MKTEITTCDTCLATVTDGGWSFYGYEGDTEYESRDWCSLECAVSGISQLRTETTR